MITEDNECNGCITEEATHKRSVWHLCDDCTTQYDRQKAKAKAALTLTTYTPDARRWRLTGTALGDISHDDIGVMMDYKLRRPIIVEGTCKWCAICTALMSIDPWAFDACFGGHGDAPEHDADHIAWAMEFMDDLRELVIEDLGPVPEDMWGNRLGWPQLFPPRRRKVA